MVANRVSAVCSEFLKSSAIDRDKRRLLVSFIEGRENRLAIDDDLRVLEIYYGVAREIEDKDIIDWVEFVDRLIDEADGPCMITCSNSSANDKTFFCSVACRSPGKNLLVSSEDDYLEENFEECRPNLWTGQ